LNATDCFYSDRFLDNLRVKCFTAKDRNAISPLEYGRWMREYIKMGWHVSENEIKD